MIFVILIYDYYFNNEKPISIDNNIGKVIISGEKKQIFVNLALGKNTENITGIKFILKDKEGKEYEAKTNLSIQNISIPLNNNLWKKIFDPDYRGTFDYAINSSEFGLENFSDIISINIEFSYRPGSGEEVTTPSIDTNQPTDPEENYTSTNENFDGSSYSGAEGSGNEGNEGETPENNTIPACTPILSCSNYLGLCGAGFSDGCNNVLDCSDNCDASKSCVNSVCVTDCFPTKTCSDYNGFCGVGFSNGCNDVLDCSNNCGGDFCFSGSGVSQPTCVDSGLKCISTGSGVNKSGNYYPNTCSSSTDLFEYFCDYDISTSQMNIKNHTLKCASNNCTNGKCVSPPLSITAYADGTGSITPQGIISINPGESKTFFITSPDGYYVTNVVIDNKSQGVISSYTFSNIASNHSISVGFLPDPSYILIASANTGGSIFPNGNIPVIPSENQTFTITPDPNFYILDVIVDNVSQGPTTNYTFSEVIQSHTISANFGYITGVKYTINAYPGPNGMIYPSGNITVFEGARQTFKITPSPGYSESSLTIDKDNSGSASSNYTFKNVTANHIIHPGFTLNSLNFKINSTAGANGAISPSGITSVNYGADQTFSFTPSPGYHVWDVKVDGTDLGAINTYTFTNVTTKHSIAVYFTNAYYRAPHRSWIKLALVAYQSSMTSQQLDWTAQHLDLLVSPYKAFFNQYIGPSQMLKCSIMITIMTVMLVMIDISNLLHIVNFMD